MLPVINSYSIHKLLHLMRLFLNSQVSLFVLRGAFFDSSIRSLHRNIKHVINLFSPSLTKLLKPGAS